MSIRVINYVTSLNYLNSTNKNLMDKNQLKSKQNVSVFKNLPEIIK